MAEHGQPLTHGAGATVNPLTGVRDVGVIPAVAAIAAGQHLEAAVVGIDAVRRHLLNNAAGEAELLDALRSIPGEAARGRAVAAWESSVTVSESVGESLARVRMVRLGFEPPELQWVVEADGHRYRPDFAWPEAALLGEFDGRGKYADGDEALIRRAEKAREESLRRIGFRVFRLTWADLNTPSALRRALAGNGVPPASRALDGSMRRFG